MIQKTFNFLKLQNHWRDVRAHFIHLTRTECNEKGRISKIHKGALRNVSSVISVFKK